MTADITDRMTSNPTLRPLVEDDVKYLNELGWHFVTSGRYSPKVFSAPNVGSPWLRYWYRSWVLEYKLGGIVRVDNIKAGQMRKQLKIKLTKLNQKLLSLSDNLAIEANRVETLSESIPS
jgi:hypothetical protein